MKPTPPAQTSEKSQPAATQAVSETELAVADTVGRLMHFWGFKRPMGRLWTLLYLSPTPRGAAELGHTLKMSAGSVSMALAELEKWGAISRTWIPGDRRDYFSAEPDVWKMVRRVFQERELSLIQDFRRNLERANKALCELETSQAQDMDADLQYKRERLSHLGRLSQAGEFLLNALVKGNAINPAAAFSVPPCASHSPHASSSNESHRN